VTYAPAALSKNGTTAFASPRSAILIPSGIPAANPSSRAQSPSLYPGDISVMKNPGLTELTLMPLGASSTASDLVKARMAPLDAQ